MSPRTRTTPRKKPQQDRSRGTVDAILEATARVLVRDGYDRASTNRVAQEAGVSVGSLYQYFPSKEALVAALVDRHADAMMAVVRERIGALATTPLREAVHATIEAVFAAHNLEPALHRVFIEQLPRVGRLQRIRALETDLAAVLAVAMSARAGELRRQNHELAALVVVHAVDALVHAAAFERPAGFRDEALIEELTDMVQRYLVRDEVPAVNASATRRAPAPTQS